MAGKRGHILFVEQVQELRGYLADCIALLDDTARNRHMGRSHYNYSKLLSHFIAAEESVPNDYQRLRESVGSKMETGDASAREQMERILRTMRLEIVPHLLRISRRTPRFHHGYWLRRPREWQESPHFHDTLVQWENLKRDYSDISLALSQRIYHGMNPTRNPLPHGSFSTPGRHETTYLNGAYPYSDYHETGRDPRVKTYKTYVSEDGPKITTTTRVAATPNASGKRARSTSVKVDVRDYIDSDRRRPTSRGRRHSVDEDEGYVSGHRSRSQHRHTPDDEDIFYSTRRPSFDDHIYDALHPRSSSRRRREVHEEHVSNHTPTPAERRRSNSYDSFISVTPAIGVRLSGSRSPRPYQRSSSRIRSGSRVRFEEVRPRHRSSSHHRSDRRHRSPSPYPLSSRLRTSHLTTAPPRYRGSSVLLDHMKNSWREEFIGGRRLYTNAYDPSNTRFNYPGHDAYVRASFGLSGSRYGMSDGKEYERHDRRERQDYHDEEHRGRERRRSGRVSFSRSLSHERRSSPHY